jgi:hypothetical protein
MTAVLPPVIDAAVAAARADDLHRLDGLVDWPLSGIGTVLTALGRIDAADRDAIVTPALADLHSTDRTTRAGTLRTLRDALRAAGGVRPADDHERRALRTAVGGSPVPDGFPQLADLAARAAAVTDGYVAEGLVFAVADGRLVVPR